MPRLAGMRVLVTGGAGFIGSHVVERLLDGGAEAVVVDDLSTGDLGNLAHLEGRRGLEVHVCDAGRPPREALAGITHGAHLAARTDVAASVKDPALYWESNVLGSVRALEAMAAAGARVAVVASSAAVYGELPPPVAEDATARPISPYGAGKLAVDLLAHHYGAHTGMRVTPLRFFNVYGPRQHPRSPYSGVISVFAKAALAGEELVVHGDGGQTRDFVFASDVAEAVERALQRPEAAGEPINIASGRGTSIASLAAEVNALAGARSAIRHGPPRPGDIRYSVARVDRARERLGFEARVLLPDGLSRTIQWMRGRP
jgi:nucleoside-diphosphate-sugar epimerase